MKVRELIWELQRHDPDTEIGVFDVAPKWYFIIQGVDIKDGDLCILTNGALD